MRIPAIHKTLFAFVAGLFLLAETIEQASAQSPRIVPRHPAAKQMPEMARYVRDSSGGSFDGRYMYAVGDVSGDGLADLLLRRERRDLDVPGRFPTDLVLFFGKPGAYPSVDEGIRIGPTEQEAEVSFVAAGDWDGDGHRDLATHIEVYGDTTVGNSVGAKGAGHLVIWWGRGAAGFSLDDTTHLSIGLEAWIEPDASSTSRDFNRDGIEDLLLVNTRGFLDSSIVYPTPIRIWYGTRGKRWGQDVSNTADWHWSTVEFYRSFTVFPKTHWIDQDGDGYTDFVRYFEPRGGSNTGWISIIYGTPDLVLDTANVVTVSLDSAWGKQALFADITGDLVPELLVNTGGQEVLKAYVGLPGQRIEEQYGLGNEPARPGEKQWWGKPWASIPLPAKLHDGWAPAGWSTIYDLGDGGLDGVGDVWLVSAPDLICYNGGNRFDSLYDGFARVSGRAIPLGDMTGDGVSAIAVGLGSPTGLAIIEPQSDFPTGGRPRPMVPGTEQPLTSVGDEKAATGSSSTLGLRIEPNPSDGLVRIRWQPTSGPVTVRITDVLGQAVMSLTVPGESGSIEWDASGMFGGRYWVTIELNGFRDTEAVDIRR